MPSKHFCETLWKQISQTRWWKTFTGKNHLQVFGALFAERMGRSSTEVSQKRGDVMIFFDTLNERQASRSYLHIYQETWTTEWSKAPKCSKQRQDTSNSVQASLKVPANDSAHSILCAHLINLGRTLPERPETTQSSWNTFRCLSVFFFPPQRFSSKELRKVLRWGPTFPLTDWSLSVCNYRNTHFCSVPSVSPSQSFFFSRHRYRSARRPSAMLLLGCCHHRLTAVGRALSPSPGDTDECKVQICCSALARFHAFAGYSKNDSDHLWK